MKNIVLILLSLIIGSLTIFSAQAKPPQTTDNQSKNNFPISVGPYLTLKAGVNTTTVDGMQNAVNFNGMPDLGVTAYIPFSEKSPIGGFLDLGLCTHSFGLKLISEKTGGFGDITWKNYYQYFNISPNLYLGGFTLGFNFGFPISAKFKDYEIDNPNISSLEQYLGENEADSENLNTLIEVTIGGMIPVLADETGRLNIIIRASYTFSNLYEGSDNLNQLFKVSYPEIIPASVSLGIDYLFNIQ